jgi:hypothetical protein
MRISTEALHGDRNGKHEMDLSALASAILNLARGGYNLGTSTAEDKKGLGAELGLASAAGLALTTEAGKAYSLLAPSLKAALLIHGCLSLLNGVGATDKGASVVLGRSKAESASLALDGARGGSGWQGVGADAYAADNLKQSSRVETLRKLDLDLIEILKTEADQVDELRNNFGYVGTSITAGIAAVAALFFAYPPASVAAAVNLDIVWAAAALVADVALMGVQGSESATIATKLAAVAAEYDTIMTA